MQMMPSGRDKKDPQRDSSSDESDHDSTDSIQVESLVAGREKRSAAGNRYSSLIQAEVDKEDEVALLFAEEEGEEDNEFQEDEADASDVQLDTSSDDDDQGPTAGADSLEGEVELQKQDREERKKRRKAQDLFKQPRSTKKVKYDPTTPSSMSTPKPVPKKKSERTSWIPTPDQGPTRSSQRKQTVLNKEITHLRLQESEVRRRQTIKAMEAAAKKKEALKPKAMTQEDRLAEAARFEKMNEKSLTKWEENEKKRVEEQKARLAALHNRQLEGPVITYWSGPAKWRDEKLTAVGIREIRGGGSDGAKEGNPKKPSRKGQDPFQEIASMIKPKPPETGYAVQLPNQSSGSEPFNPAAPVLNAQSSTQSHETASLPVMSACAQHEIAGTLPSQVYSVPAYQPQEEFSGHHSSAAPHQQVHVVVERTSAAPLQGQYVQPVSPQPPPRPKTPVVEITSRNIIALQNVDLNCTDCQIPELQDHVLLAKKPTRGSAKQAQLNAATRSNLGRVSGSGRQQTPCAITGQNAKYRDPETGLTYANIEAYKQIQKIATGETRWSEERGGCYTGSTMRPARGVPERFFQS